MPAWNPSVPPSGAGQPSNLTAFLTPCRMQSPAPRGGPTSAAAMRSSARSTPAPTALNAAHRVNNSAGGSQWWRTADMQDMNALHNMTAVLRRQLTLISGFCFRPGILCEPAVQDAGLGTPPTHAAPAAASQVGLADSEADQDRSYSWKSWRL